MKSSNWFGFLLISLFVIAMLPSSRSLSISPPKNIVIVGGGIQGMSVAYHLAERIRNRGNEVSSSSTTTTTTITILEANELASAASGKGGGFMARSWGDGTATQGLHELSFDRYEELCPKIGCTSYRKLPVLSVTPNQGRQNNNNGGGGGISKGRKANYANLLPDWLDGDESIRMVSPMGYGQDTAQVTPHDFVMKLWEHISQSTNTVDEDNSSNANNLSVRLVLGTCTGVETTTTTTTTDTSQHKVLTGIKYRPKSSSSSLGDKDNSQEECTLPADIVVISAGPWSCAAEDWFEGSISLPMEGIKSTSIVWKKPNDIDQVDATALFCGEDYQYGTHLEVYPRPDGTIYLCGIGGSDYISKDALKEGAFREDCPANPQRVVAASQAFQKLSSLYRTDGELQQIQACMRPCPPDALPYMGSIPGYGGVYLNAGHNCWGIAWAPACGIAMTELILDGKSKSIDLSPFDPSRFTKKVTGGRGRKQRGTNVGEQW